MRAFAIAPLLLVTSCASSCGDNDPAWSKTPAGGVQGDGTVAGAPASVKRASAAPVIDGKLDDAAWSGATVLGPFVEPGSGAAPSGSPVEGFAKVLWDDQKLYLGFVVRDGWPSAPFGREDQDPHLWEQSSAVEIMLQPGDPGDNRGYYELQVDTRGAVFDTAWDDYNVPITEKDGAKAFGHMEWSGNLERAAFVQSGSFYSVEVAMPWSALKPARTAVPPKTGDVWRLDLYSFRDGQRYALAWSPIRGQGNFHRSTRFGRVRFE